MWVYSSQACKVLGGKVKGKWLVVVSFLASVDGYHWPTCSTKGEVLHELTKFPRGNSCHVALLVVFMGKGGCEERRGPAFTPWLPEAHVFLLRTIH